MTAQSSYMRLMKLSFIVFLLFLIQLISFTISSAQTPEITNGINYLISTQNPDGSWGNDTSTTDILTATVSVIETFQIIDQTGTSNYTNAVSWLQSQTLETTNYLSERIHVLSLGGADSSLLLSYLDELEYVWGGHDDYGVNILDTSFALKALKKINYSDLNTFSQALGYLVESQNTDGGWGFYRGDDSNVYMTAIVLQTFNVLSATFDIQSSIINAVSYLHSQQNTDGGFGNSPSTVYETSLAFEALVTSKADISSIAQPAIDYLISTQLLNGSWNNDSYSTALALRVLGNLKPDLNITVDDIAFSNQTPAQGEISTITATIYNTGLVQADNVMVQFYDGDPKAGGVQIGSDQVISTIAPYGNSSVEVIYDTSGKLDCRYIHVTVDPLNSITELNEGDNRAVKVLKILKPGDLFIDGREIFYFPFDLKPDTTFTIISIIRNLGEMPIENITVALYDGQPNAGGIKLEEKVISVINPFKSSIVSFDLNGQSIGSHSYYIYVDPYNQLIEPDESNNIGYISIDIKDPNITEPDSTDLYITQSDISFNPVYPDAGQSVTITAVVHNTSNHTVTDLDVSFYNGDPKDGGILLGTVNTWVAQWSTQTVSFTWIMPGGAPVIYVVIDKDKKIAENDETNNIAYKPINTYAADLSVTERDVTLNPVLPEKGQPVSINVAINNLGNIGSSGRVNVYEVDSEGVKTLFWESDIFVNGTGTTTVSIEGWTFPYKSSTIAVVIDNVSPDDSDLSNNETIVIYGEDIKPGSSNEGKEFSIVMPETYYHTASIIIQSKITAKVKILGPFISWAGTVSPGSPVTIPLIHGETEVSSNGVIEDKGINITSDEDISVIFKAPNFADVADDAYLAIPIKSLGTNYYNISYAPVYNTNSFSRITIVAPYENTNVKIGDTLINLNKGQTYQIKSNTIDYTGVHIRSDKPVAVFSGVTCTYIPYPNECIACDTLLAQVLPVSLWSTDYFTGPLYSPDDSDLIRVVAGEDNTIVTIKSEASTETVTLDKGQWEEIDVETATHLTSNNPIEVAQFAKGLGCAGKGDPFEMLMIPTDKLRMDYRFFVPQGYEQGNFATIIAPEPETNIVLDGELIVPDWVPLPDKGNYTMVSLAEGEHSIVSDKPVAVYSHGYRYFGSYGYPVGFGISLPDLTVDEIHYAPQNPSESQLVKLSTTLSNPGEKCAKNVLVRAYSGDPTVVGIQVGDDRIIDIIYPKESIPIEFVWDTYGFRHVNTIYVIADPLDDIEEENENNNTSIIEIDMNDPLNPDLTISDIILSQPTVNEGEEIVVTVVVKNRGTAVNGIPVSLYLGNPEYGGVLLESKVIQQIIPYDVETEVVFRFVTLGYHGIKDLYIVIDPLNIIDELIEDNNIASRTVDIKAKELNLKVTTDKTQYDANSDVGINVHVLNENIYEWSGVGDVYIKDEIDNIVDHVATFNIDDLDPVGISGWTYRVPAFVTTTTDKDNSLASSRVDFSDLIAAVNEGGKALDVNSIRVLEMDGQGNYLGEKIAKFIPDMGFDPVFNAEGMVLWLMDGLTLSGVTRYYYIYFDIADNGPKEPSVNTSLPDTGNLIGYIDYYGMIYVFRNNGDGTFGPQQFVDDVSPFHDFSSGIVLSDFNNDGFTDIITGGAEGLFYYENRADMSDTFMPKVLIDSSRELQRNIMPIASGDFNRDGNYDFIVNNSLYNILYLLNGNGDGTFNKTVIPLPEGYHLFKGKGVADVDRDGYLDLVAADSYGVLFLYHGQEDWTSVQPVEIADVGTDTYGVALADFDSDGNVDIIACDKYSYYGYILRGNGDGTFMPLEPVPSLATPYIYATSYASGDFNDDGNKDIIANIYISKDLFYFEGNGDGTFKGYNTIPSDSYYSYAISSSGIYPSVFPAVGIPEKAPDKTFNFIWNTGITSPGPYQVYVTLSEGQVVVAEDSTPFEIITDFNIVTGIVSDKIAYNANETVELTSTITSQSANFIFEDLTAKVTVKDAQGQTLYTDERAIMMLTPSAYYSFKSYWDTGAHPVGIYTVTFNVIEGNTLISTSQATFEILGTFETGEGLIGTLTAQPNPVYHGQDVTFGFSITNSGNEDIPDLNVKILVVDPETEELMLEVETTENCPKDTTITDNLVSSTASLAPKVYLAILQVSTQDMTEPRALDTETFEVLPVLPAIDITKYIPDIKNVLVWLNYQWQSGHNTPDITVIEQALAEAGIQYTMVFDKKDFQAEFVNNPFYTDYMILGDQHPLEDHYSDKLMMEIASGKGLISSMFNRQNMDESVFGIKFRGHLSGNDYPVELIESEIAGTGDFQTLGRSLRVDAVNGEETVGGWIVKTTKKGEKLYPAIVSSSYGYGNVLFYAFDLGMSYTDYQAFAELIRNSLEFVHTPFDAQALPPNRFIPVEIRIESLGGLFDLEVKESVPLEIKLYDPETGQLIPDNPWITLMHLEPNEVKTLMFYILTPETQGSYTLNTTVSYLDNGIYIFYEQLNTDINVVE